MSLNIATSIPQILPNAENFDFKIFIDVANVWEVDYSSTLSDSNKIRSSFGIGVDFFTVIGPLSFSLAEVITKGDFDKPETFRFNLGTVF